MFENSWSYHPNCLIPEDQSLPDGINRIAAAVEYNGRTFCGWQRQSHSPAVQQAVEQALSFVANESITTVCAGRTDTGVHATNQIVHFDTRAQRDSHNWIQGANSRLPDGVRLHWAGKMEKDFHARFAASSRTYRYVIYNGRVPSALFRGMVTFCKAELDEADMQQAARALLGERDFSSYRAAGCQSRTPFRNVQEILVWRQGALVIVEVKANAFLHHMVRNIVGALFAVGRREKPVSWPAELLDLKDRTAGEMTAPSDGLYLVNVEYPLSFPIPHFDKGPLFVSS